MAGIKETKEALRFGIALGEGVAASLIDGKVTFLDAVNFYSALMAAGDAIKDASQIPSELADLSEEEIAELKEFVMTEFDIDQDAIENAIKGGLNLVFSIVSYINGLRRP